ncbi:hypothetical protein LTR70_004572 [Exophiala xenobiotica]|uniref:BZIP domain-containing protein n=1 Tax=Lithohypha guttulata TaxID=1690604 RepID=A0ABR0KCZ3_9EURO|nr:hypothetical protein LTR24_004171 [Lithohypha guttulata]KAK5320346.1 hypothetical protein LTR70_004572 [Exophiala xenobiotica]
MDLGMNFPEHLDTSIDEFFTYDVMTPVKELYNEDAVFDFQGWQEQVQAESLSEYHSNGLSLSNSRSSSLPSDAVQSPILAAALPRANSDGAFKFRLTWPGEGQNQARKRRVRKPTASDLHVRSKSVTSTTSAEDMMPVDPHHEGSCAKCRMTEVEARKCRLERRREQNRASQRKFRARKEAKIREAASQVATLETYVDFLEKHNGDLEATNADLRQQIISLQKTQRMRLSTPTDSTGGDDFVSIPQVSWSSLSASKMTTATTAISTTKRQVVDLYLPLFDHELEPQHRYSTK